MFRSGFATVLGDGSDAHLAVGTAELPARPPPDGGRAGGAGRPRPARLALEAADLLPARRGRDGVGARDVAGVPGRRGDPRRPRRAGFFLLARDTLGAGLAGRGRGHGAGRAGPRRPPHDRCTRTSTSSGASSPCPSRWCSRGGRCRAARTARRRSRCSRCSSPSARSRTRSRCRSRSSRWPCCCGRSAAAPPARSLGCGRARVAAVDRPARGAARLPAYGIGEKAWTAVAPVVDPTHDLANWGGDLLAFFGRARVRRPPHDRGARRPRPAARGRHRPRAAAPAPAARARPRRRSSSSASSPRSGSAPATSAGTSTSRRSRSPGRSRCCIAAVAVSRREALALLALPVLLWLALARARRTRCRRPSTRTRRRSRSSRQLDDAAPPRRLGPARRRPHRAALGRLLPQRPAAVLAAPAARDELPARPDLPQGRLRPHRAPPARSRSTPPARRSGKGSATCSTARTPGVPGARLLQPPHATDRHRGALTATFPAPSCWERRGTSRRAGVASMKSLKHRAERPLACHPRAGHHGLGRGTGRHHLAGDGDQLGRRHARRHGRREQRGDDLLLRVRDDAALRLAHARRRGRQRRQRAQASATKVEGLAPNTRVPLPPRRQQPQRRATAARTRNFKTEPAAARPADHHDAEPGRVRHPDHGRRAR